MQRIVVTAVLVFLFDLATNLEAVIRCDCDVARIEQAVDVATQEQAIMGLVFATVAVRSNVGRLKGG